jgi:hypothetical protein
MMSRSFILHDVHLIMKHQIPVSLTVKVTEWPTALKTHWTGTQEAGA